MSLAILPGSFDPMTLGHRALAFEVAEQYDEVVVAV
ncbi:MAG: adenylyltransferase/cytidyltransferase family protein, partial [Clostridia bacterium]|nr:adenylyltransferase/cytidyltransferase family protein [Clostridia bacterium]